MAEIVLAGASCCPPPTLYVVEEFAISTNPSEQGSAAISGDIVVWEDFRNLDTNGDIYGARLSLEK